MTTLAIGRVMAGTVIEKFRHWLWKLQWGWRSHTEYQRSVMDARAGADPRAAVGGMWEEIGHFQVQVLKELGLSPADELLDIGCGSLRGGVPLIDYLSPGNYWGTDISPQLLRNGSEYLEDARLGEKKANLLLVTDFSLKEVGDRKFDFVQAWGVFTDIPKSLVIECLKSVTGVLSPEGIFLATFALGKNYRADHARLQFRYPWSFFENLKDQVDLELKFGPGFSYRHPKGHSLLLATRKQ